ncbi:hypothetical protein D1872_305810 [compost metagenome]
MRQQRCAAGVQRLERGFALRAQRIQQAVGQHHGRPAIAGLDLAPQLFAELQHILRGHFGPFLANLIQHRFIQNGKLLIQPLFPFCIP